MCYSPCCCCAVGVTMTGDLFMFKLQHLSGMYIIKCKILIGQNHSQPYKNLWLDWGRFRPELGHKAIFKARTERDKVRQPFCAIEWNISQVCLSLIMWRKWVRKSEIQPIHLRHCTRCHTVLSVKLSLHYVQRIHFYCSCQADYSHALCCSSARLCTAWILAKSHPECWYRKELSLGLQYVLLYLKENSTWACGTMEFLFKCY